MECAEESSALCFVRPSAVEGHFALHVLTSLIQSAAFLGALHSWQHRMVRGLFWTSQVALALISRGVYGMLEIAVAIVAGCSDAAAPADEDYDEDHDEDF